LDRVVTLSTEELRRRARSLRLVLTDCDGVLTDGSVYYSDRGEELRRFDVRDGMGFELLRKDGLACGILSREPSQAIVRRAQKLKLEHVFVGVTDKLEWLARSPIAAEQIAYIGDDVNDAPLMERIAAAGLTAAPADARPVAHERAHLRCAAPGGRAAFREFADWIVELRSAGGPT
jgi:3-deoxy-D-manno-octulosonate 8-phosphate phosphatase (KDO 8-P phosphatase)